MVTQVLIKGPNKSGWNAYCEQIISKAEFFSRLHSTLSKRCSGFANSIGNQFISCDFNVGNSRRLNHFKLLTKEQTFVFPGGISKARIVFFVEKGIAKLRIFNAISEKFIMELEYDAYLDMFVTPRERNDFMLKRWLCCESDVLPRYRIKVSQEKKEIVLVGWPKGSRNAIYIPEARGKEVLVSGTIKNGIRNITLTVLDSGFREERWLLDGVLVDRDEFINKQIVVHPGERHLAKHPDLPKVTFIFSTWQKRPIKVKYKRNSGEIAKIGNKNWSSLMQFSLIKHHKKTFVFVGSKGFQFDQLREFTLKVPNLRLRTKKSESLIRVCIPLFDKLIFLKKKFSTRFINMIGDEKGLFADVFLEKGNIVWIDVKRDGIRIGRMFYFIIRDFEGDIIASAQERSSVTEGDLPSQGYIVERKKVVNAHGSGSLTWDNRDLSLSKPFEETRGYYISFIVDGDRQIIRADVCRRPLTNMYLVTKGKRRKHDIRVSEAILDKYKYEYIQPTERRAIKEIYFWEPINDVKKKKMKPSNVIKLVNNFNVISLGVEKCVTSGELDRLIRKFTNLSRRLLSIEREEYEALCAKLDVRYRIGLVYIINAGLSKLQKEISEKQAELLLQEVKRAEKGVSEEDRLFDLLVEEE